LEVKVLAEGAEAVVYKTALEGVPALLKRRIQKKYRIVEMDTKIRTRRSKNEARIIATASEAGINSPKLLLFDGYDIYMTAIEGKKLTDVPATTALFEKIGVVLGQLHAAGIVHGDYTPANIIVGRDGPYVIDFGLSEITNSAEEKALDLLLMKRSVVKGSYNSFVKGYRKQNDEAAEVLERLEVIERRGRYQTRTLT
jgi:Kae1-associated kinase Bud32